jgi:polyhydroxyalkanoate synthesis regulator phasin
MSEKIIQIISEVNRMNDLMMFSEGKEVLNESMASALKSLRTLIRNGIGDITRYGIKEVDNLAKAMMKAKTTDEFFDLLNDIKLHDVEIAKQLRRDIFDILPESTKNKIRLMVTQIENNIDSIPENKLDDLLDDLIEGEFPNEPESVRNYMKDTLSDSSDKISNKIDNANAASNINNLIDDVINKMDDVVPPKLPDNEVSKTWIEKLGLKRDEYKRFLEDAKKNGSPAKYWDRKTFDEKMAEVSRMGETADKDAVRWIEMTAKNNPSWWKQKPWWAKALWVASAIGVGPEILEVIYWLFTQRISGFSIFGITEKLDDLTNQAGGGLRKLDSSNESEIKLAIANISDKYTKLGAFDDSKYTLDYSANGQSVSVVSLTPPYDTLHTYDRNQINESLNTL